MDKNKDNNDLPIFHRIPTRIIPMDMMFLSYLLFVKHESIESLMSPQAMEELKVIDAQPIVISEPAEHAGSYYLWAGVYNQICRYDDSYRGVFSSLENDFYRCALVSAGEEWRERTRDIMREYQTHLHSLAIAHQEAMNAAGRSYARELRSACMIMSKEQKGIGHG